MLSPSGIWIPDHNKSHPGLVTDGVEIPFEELPSRLADQEWQLEHSVPMPSPEVQSEPGDAVRRPVSADRYCTPSGICTMLRMQRKVMRPGAVFKREEKGPGMGRGAKIALGVAGGVAVVGGGYLAWRHMRRRG